VIGDAITSVTLVLDGLCARVDMPSEDRRQITAIYIKGNVFDLGGIFEPEAPATIEALTDASIVRVPHGDMRALMRVYPAVAEAFGRYLMGDAAITAEWLINVGGREARAALAHLFCEMAVRMGRVDGNSFSFHFPLSQMQLSEATGLSAVHVNRSLGSLRRDGLMRMAHGMVQVPDWEALKRGAHFNSRYLAPESARRFAH
jgi:CRP-like cAMP-binding protein